MSEFLTPRRLDRLRAMAFRWEGSGFGGAKTGRHLADCPVLAALDSPKES